MRMKTPRTPYQAHLRVRLVLLSSGGILPVTNSDLAEDGLVGEGAVL